MKISEELHMKILDILGWFGWWVLVIWIIAKAFGWINTPTWISLAPFAGLGVAVVTLFSKAGKYIEKTNNLEKRIDRFENRMEARFDKIDKRFDSFESKIDTRFEKMEKLIMKNSSEIMKNRIMIEKILIKMHV